MQNAVGIKANKVESLPHCNKRKKDWHKHLALGTISKKTRCTKSAGKNDLFCYLRIIKKYIKILT